MELLYKSIERMKTDVLGPLLLNPASAALNKQVVTAALFTGTELYASIASLLESSRSEESRMAIKSLHSAIEGLENIQTALANRIFQLNRIKEYSSLTKTEKARNEHVGSAARSVQVGADSPD